MKPMKRVLLLAIFMTSITLVMAQSIERTMVVIDKGTGTWCGWCPSAAQGCEDLLEAGAPIAVVSNQNGDAYANQYSNARNTMYQISGYPTSVFDGKEKSIGGSTSGTTIGTYAPIVQNHMVEMCPLSLELEVENTDADYTATVTITKLGDITATDLRLMFFVTESHIPQNWFSMTELNHVNRLMVPDQNGTAFDFSSGDVQEIELNFTMTPSWVEENCEFIVCVQNADAGQPGGAWVNEILNGIKRGVIDLTADFEADVTNIDVGDPVSFTSEYEGGYIGPVPVTYHWEFPGATPDTSNEVNPTVTYTQSGTHDVTLTINKGGQLLDILKPGYIYVAPGVGISDPSAVLAMNLYPNPSNGQFRVELFTIEPAVVNIEIVSTLNAVIYQERGVSMNEKLLRNFNLNLNSGIYYMIVRDGERKQVRKLIIL